MITNSLSKTRSSIIIFSLLLAVILVTLMMYVFKSSAEKKSVKKNLTSISVLQLQITNNNPKINLFGTIINPYITKLKSPINTYVDEVLVHTTEYVKQGKLLIKLNIEELHNDIELQKNKIQSINQKIALLDKNYEFDQQLLKAEKHKLKIAKKNVSRFEELQKKQAISKKQADDALFDLENSQLATINRQKEIDTHPIKKSELKHQLQQANNELDNLLLDLKRSNITSPIDGYITQINAAKGSKAEPGQTLIELHDNNKTEIRCQIPELYVSEIYQATKAKKITTGITEIYNTLYTLDLLNISAITRLNQGGADAIFRFKDNTPPLAIIGKTVKVQVTMPVIPNSYLIPLSAIYHDKFIYKISDSKLKSIKINILGIDYVNNKEYLIIKSSDLKPNDLILVSTLATANEGLPVKIVKTSKVKFST
tara:strand:+ start:15954 stop:17231 length:1278 start_codon:yes stop_codon:yes gene_type:complete